MVTLLVMLDFLPVLILMMHTGNLVSKTQIGDCLFQWSEETIQLAFIPMKKEAEAGSALRLLAEDVGVPNRLTMDNANTMTGLNTIFQKTAQHLRIKTSAIEAHTPRQNPQERQIGS
eukprot:6884894-Ditylum_brightwellii.AAC.1